MEIDASQLMTAAKGGDDRAFEQLVERLRSRAFAVAQSLVGSREDALDMAQEAFLKTYRARDTFRDGEPFLPWFHRILRNTCFSFLRKRGRIRRAASLSAREDDEGDWEIEDRDSPAPSRGAELAEEQAAFWKAFQGLKSNDREILGLRHFQDLPYKEIALALGCPVGTVMSRLFHARRRLRERLGPLLEMGSELETSGDVR